MVSICTPICTVLFLDPNDDALTAVAAAVAAAAAVPSLNLRRSLCTLLYDHFHSPLAVNDTPSRPSIVKSSTMLSKSLLVSIALAAASVHADLYISTPPELKQVSSSSFFPNCLLPRPAAGPTSAPRHAKGLVVDDVITVRGGHICHQGCKRPRLAIRCVSRPEFDPIFHALMFSPQSSARPLHARTLSECYLYPCPSSAFLAVLTRRCPYSRELDDVTGDLKWKPDLPVGTSVQLAIEDEAGNEAWSGAVRSPWFFRRVSVRLTLSLTVDHQAWKRLLLRSQ